METERRHQYLAFPTGHLENCLVTKFSGAVVQQVADLLAAEEPLEIKLVFSENGVQMTKNVSVTMRTPGNDEELSTGFLFTEGLIDTDHATEKLDPFICAKGKQNSVAILITSGPAPDLRHSERNFYTTSSCGVCGKSSIESIRTVSKFLTSNTSYPVVNHQLLLKLPDALRNHQHLFESTGGLHACGLFNIRGELIMVREDVGRHNALDKLIGRAYLDGLLPLADHILLLSGRASFELVQKAAMAGITIIAAIGAPSSLAVQLAGEFNITLAGFLRGESFNVYAGAERIN